ncbi:uncharacterized protein LOC34623409 [Cyclospora cayetanensis]|uniref:Uncharacterized protein LOC34623409 n=1 Tax=Cyclospora cayetanensis TaxID=88456 RepID=A0A6P6S2M7_9EIME|nr:uncharacterized protein LOC34623409 [Cyclospora cayetanensis]
MEEGYEFEFESNGGPWGPEQEAAVAVENLYYEAQDLHLLEEVVQREADVVHKPWTCKALLSLTLLALGEGTTVEPLVICSWFCSRSSTSYDCCALQYSRFGESNVLASYNTADHALSSTRGVVLLAATSGNFDCAGAHYQRLLQQIPTVAAGEAAATVEAVLSAAAKLVGIEQHNGLPDIFVAAPLQKQQQQKQETDGQVDQDSPLNVSAAEASLRRPSSAKGGQVLEKLMLYTLEALTSQGMKKPRVHVYNQLLRLYIHLGEWHKAKSLLPEVHQAWSDPSLPLHQQLEAAAVEALWYTYSRDWPRLQQLMPHALRLASASLDPRSTAAIRECGARLLMELQIHPGLHAGHSQVQEQKREQQQPWVDIHAHLMAAFRHHQEIGDIYAATAALRRAVLISPLAISAVDPFSTPEGKALQDDPTVRSAKALRTAFEASDIAGVEEVRRKPYSDSKPFTPKPKPLLALHLRELRAKSYHPNTALECKAAG